MSNKLIPMDIFIKFINGDPNDLIKILDSRYFLNDEFDKSMIVDSSNDEFPYQIISDTRKNMYNKYLNHTHTNNGMKDYNRLIHNIKYMTDILEEHRLNLYMVLQRKHIDVNINDSMEKLLSKLPELDVINGFFKNVNISISYNNNEYELTVNSDNRYYRFSTDGINWYDEIINYPVQIGNEYTIYGMDNEGNIYSKNITIDNEI